MFVVHEGRKLQVMNQGGAMLTGRTTLGWLIEVRADECHPAPAAAQRQKNAWHGFSLKPGKKGKP